MHEMIYITVSFLVGLFASSHAMPILIKVARHTKQLSVPKNLSATIDRIPTLGGIGIFWGFIMGLTLTSDGYVFPGLNYVVSVVTIMFFVGLKCDIDKNSALIKLASEICVASILIFLGHFRFTNLHGFLGIETIPFGASVLLTGLIYIVLINAFNLIEAIDGLAAGLSIFAASVFGVWFFLTNHFELSIVSFSLIGGLSGFFLFNVYGTKNKILMGNSGSLILGTIMAFLVIEFNELNLDKGTPYFAMAAPAVSFSILIYLLLELLRVFSIRFIQRISPFTANKNHTFHRLLVLRLKQRFVTFLILAICTAFTITAFELQWIGINELMLFNFLAGGILLILPAALARRRIKSSEDYLLQKIVHKNEVNQLSGSIS
ncbi:MAG: MraY family glycosyltransferase [Prolixibacteraceae bacterium]